MIAGPAIRAFFDEPTNTVSYLVSDPVTKRAELRNWSASSFRKRAIMSRPYAR
jgi:hypothetical protein